MKPACGLAIVATDPTDTITVTCSNIGAGVTVISPSLKHTDCLTNNMMYIEIIQFSPAATPSETVAINKPYAITGGFAIVSLADGTNRVYPSCSWTIA